MKTLKQESESAPTRRAEGPRIASIDLTKGALILLILAYHSLNYSNKSYLGFKYLGWLPVSFILISGSLLSHVYSRRFAIDSQKVCRRLLIRGQKLVALFTLLNIGVIVLRRPNHQPLSDGILAFSSHWREVYITGEDMSGEGRIASFRILLPIAYLLLLAPALLKADRLHRWGVPCLTVLLIAGCVIMELNHYLSANIALLSAGFLGILLGRAPLEKLNEISRHLGFAILAYLWLFAIGVAFGQNYIIQAVEACAGVALTYAACAKLEANTVCARHLIKLGQNSLLSYILQIAILQALVRAIGHPAPCSLGFFALLGGGWVFMTLIVELVAWSRRQSPGAEEAYKAVFA